MRNFVHGSILSICFCLISLFGNAQTVIQMEDVGGVYKIPCTVNGLKLKMIFDPGASNVCLSETTALMMLENDYLSVKDIKGIGKSTVADGSIVDHTKIILKKVQIGEKVLNNVEAVVIHGQDAPLLFGQTALRKLGKYSISGNKLIIGTENASNSKKGKQAKLTEEEVEQISEDAWKAYEDKAYYIAIEKYQLLDNNDRLNAYGKFIYANCYFNVDNVDDAFDIYMQIKNDIENDFPEYKVDLYIQIAACYNRNHNHDAARPYLEKGKYYAEPWSPQQKECITMLSAMYYTEGDEVRGEMVVDNYIQSYLDFKNYNVFDCWDKKYTDVFLADLYYDLKCFLCGTLLNSNIDLILAAAWGNKAAQEKCNTHKINYHQRPW